MLENVSDVEHQITLGNLEGEVIYVLLHGLSPAVYSMRLCYRRCAIFILSETRWINKRGEPKSIILEKLYLL